MTIFIKILLNVESQQKNMQLELIDVKCDIDIKRFKNLQSEEFWKQHMRQC